jgi:SAM-dependent methyltransferase
VEISNKASITLDDFLGLFDFDLSPVEISEVADLVSSKNFHYQILQNSERDRVIYQALKRFEQPLSPSGEHRESEWNDGWSENLNEFIKSNYSTNALIPKYYRPSNIKRWRGNYIFTESLSFEYDFFEVLRFMVFQAFLKTTSSVFEFGCGSPHNIVALAQQYPDLDLYACDWSEAAVQIVNLLREKNSLKLHGEVFDFFKPKLTIDVPADAVFLTIGGLEQVGENHVNFLDFVIEKKPLFCIHLEPIEELYNQSEEDLIDYLALRYHKSRNYLQGYLSEIKRLEKAGKAVISEVKRVPFGGQFHEGWSLVVWRPL